MCVDYAMHGLVVVDISHMFIHIVYEAKMTLLFSSYAAHLGHTQRYKTWIHRSHWKISLSVLVTRRHVGRACP